MIDERVAFHEAGHALILYLLDLSTSIEVVMAAVPQESILASTIYDGDHFQSFNMNNGRNYAKKLIQVAVAGCAAEVIFHKRSNILTTFNCQFGERDTVMVKKILKAMCLEDAHAVATEKQCRLDTINLLKKHQGSLERVANLLRSEAKTIYSYTDISAQIMSHRITE
jgi:ATP-dependent Zn protease